MTSSRPRRDHLLRAARCVLGSAPFPADREGGRAMPRRHRSWVSALV